MKRKILASLLLLSMAISSFSGIGGIQVHATEYNNLSTSETTEVASTESPSTEAVSTEVQTESSTEGILPELPVDLNTDLNNITGEEDLSDEISNNDNETDADVPAGITLDDLNISARDGFGELFAKEFEGEATEYSNEENIVYSVELEQGIATVSYHADIDCSLVIALYDESGKKLQTSEVTEVQSDVGTTTVTMDMSNAPSYFLLRAYLINTDTKDPLSKEYENNLYTKEMQEFLSKDVNDFNQEQVINFDDDPKTNFAVVNNDVIVVDYVEGENIVTKQDLTTEEYEIQRATDTIKNLQPGDIMLYEYKEFYLIVGVSDITVDGDTVNIKGTELEAEDVFDHIRIEESSNTDQMNYDSSECDDALSYDGLTNITAKGETSGSVSGSFKYTFKEKPINERTKFTGSIEFSGKITAKLYRSLEETYVEISGDTTIKLNVSIQAKDRLVKNFKLGYIDYMIGPVFIGFTPSFVCEVKSDISWEGSYQSGFILKVSTKGPEHITFQQKQPVIQTELKSEIDVFFGVSLEPHIWMLTPKFAEVKFTCKAGAEIKGKSSIEYSTEISDTNHDCSSCVAGEIDAVAEAKISAEILVVEFSAGVTKSSKISDFYYSFDTKKFGFTTCPNISYQYNLTVKDKKTKKPVKNAVVTIDGNEYKTDKNGHCIKFLKKGVHDITIKDSKNRSLAFNINIKNDAIKSTQYLKSADGTGDEEAGEILHSGEFDTWKWSLDSNGLLLIEGDVKGSDFSFYTPPWIDYNEDIKIAKLEGAGFGRLCSMFNGCRGLTNLDVSNFDTSKVTDMRHMFYGCRGLTNLDVSNFDTSNVTDMFGMFWGCSGLTNLDVSNFDTSKVTSMDSMFNGCSGLTNLDVSNFDTSNVTNMGSMFGGCSSLTNLDVSNFDTSNVTSMYSMFNGCSGLINLDVSNFNTSNVTDMRYMFDRCSGLTQIKSPYNINTDCDLYTNDNAKWIDESGIEVTCMHENISHSVTYTRISENNQSDEAFINSAPKNALRSLTEGDVTSNTIVNQDNYYNIYVTSNSLIENPLSKDNLLYIIQATNDTKETLCEELKASYPDASIYVTSMYKIQLEDSNITIDELTYTGKTMLPNIHVTVNDKELEQGKDYDVYGDLAVKDAGTYSITVYGIGDYSGSVSLEYKVKGNYTYSVEFDGNGAIAGTMTTLTNCESDEIYVLPTCKYKRKGFIFAGWNTKKDGSGTSYEDESKVSNLSNQNNDVVTLYAQWKPISYTIHFDKNGGTGTMKRVYPKYGRNYRLPANTFKKAGYTFAGWNTRKDGKGTTYKNQCNVKNLSSKNGELIRFYAQWKKISLATPGKPTLGNYAAGRLTVTCKEVKRADGYLIQYSTNKNMKNAKTVSTTTLKKNIYKLKKGTTYYVRVRAYKVDSTGKKVCGKYSGIQSKKVTK